MSDARAEPALRKKSRSRFSRERQDDSFDRTLGGYQPKRARNWEAGTPGRLGEDGSKAGVPLPH